MSEGERVGAWLVLLAMVGFGSLCFMQLTENERMAKQGFTPIRLPGSTEIYWVKPQEEVITHLGPKGF